jgi:hypothetical protein
MFPSIGRIVPELSGPNFLEKVRNSPDISKDIFKAGMCKFESSQASQAVRRSEIGLEPFQKRPPVAAVCSSAGNLQTPNLAAGSFRSKIMWRGGNPVDAFYSKVTPIRFSLRQTT